MSEDHISSRESSPAARVEVLGDLLERLEAATGPDRELDCYLDTLARAERGKAGRFSIVGPPTYDPRRFFFCPDPEMDWIGYDLLNVAPHYSASLDAALGLVERVLPNWLWKIACAGDDRPGRFDALLMPPHIAARDIYGEGKTPSLAILTAMIRALLANTSPSQAIGEG